MKRSSFLFSIFMALNALAIVGCATARPRPSQTPASTTTMQASEPQNQLQAKDQQIQDLQNQLESTQHSLMNNFSTKSGRGKSSTIWVAGVTPMDVQKALKRAGYDPGPADGRLGKKTKKAVKSFQRRNGLYADGIVGDKTWALLNK